MQLQQEKTIACTYHLCFKAGSKYFITSSRMFSLLVDWATPSSPFLFSCLLSRSFCVSSLSSSRTYAQLYPLEYQLMIASTRLVSVISLVITEPACILFFLHPAVKQRRHTKICFFFFLVAIGRNPTRRPAAPSGWPSCKIASDCNYSKKDKEFSCISAKQIFC